MHNAKPIGCDLALRGASQRRAVGKREAGAVKRADEAITPDPPVSQGPSRMGATIGKRKHAGGGATQQYRRTLESNWENSPDWDFLQTGHLAPAQFAFSFAQSHSPGHATLSWPPVPSGLGLPALPVSTGAYNFYIAVYKT
jgi:hypothetical protein